MSYDKSLDRLNTILAALQWSLSIEPNISQLLQDSHRTKPYLTDLTFRYTDVSRSYSPAMLNILSWLNLLRVSLHPWSRWDSKFTLILKKNQRWTARQRKSTFDHFVYNRFFRRWITFLATLLFWALITLLIVLPTLHTLPYLKLCHA